MKVAIKSWWWRWTTCIDTSFIVWLVIPIVVFTFEHSFACFWHCWWWFQRWWWCCWVIRTWICLMCKKHAAVKNECLLCIIFICVTHAQHHVSHYQSHQMRLSKWFKTITVHDDQEHCQFSISINAMQRTWLFDFSRIFKMLAHGLTHFFANLEKQAEILLKLKKQSKHSI